MEKVPREISVRIVTLDTGEVPPAGPARVRERRRYALAGLIGLPALAGTAEVLAVEPPYYCTEDADTIAMLESGSSATKLFFSNQPTAPRERQVGGERACFPLGEAENYYGVTHYAGLTPYPIPYNQTIIHLLSRFPPLAVEGAQGTVAFSITRSGAVTQPSSVAYAIGGTATQESDYGTLGGTAGVTAPTGVIEFAPGENKKVIAVSLLDDSELEEDETIQVTLSSPTAPAGYLATVLADTEGSRDAYFVSPPPQGSASEPVQATAVILDDDLQATLLPPGFWCTTNATKVDPLLQGGSSAVGVYLTQDPALADGTGVYCASVWAVPSVFTVNSSTITTTSTNISINSSTIGTSTSNISINSSTISTNTPNITVTPRITRIDPGDGSANIYFSGGLTSHTATCTPTGGGAPISATSTHSPITLTGLANGVVYSCVVRVTGTLVVSGVATVTPTAMAPPVPTEPKPVFVFAPWVLALLSALIGLFGVAFRRRKPGVEG